MKYLKTYEAGFQGKCREILDPNEKIPGRKYWLLPTDDRFEKSLEQIKAPKKFLTNQMIIKEHRFVFIGVKNDIKESYNWDWNPYLGEKVEYDFDSSGYEFMGNINIEDWEPEAYIAAKKYNL